MESRAGLSVEDAQYAICKGTYGGQEWSVADRDAACDKYEQISGAHVDRDYQATSPTTGTAATVAILCAVIIGAAIFYWLKVMRKTNKIKSKK